MERVQKIGRKFVEQGQAVNAQPVQQQNNYQQAPQQNSQPQQRQQAPAGAQQGPDGPRYCDHGQMVFRSGFNQQKQSAWSGYFCPTPKGTPNQCKAQFLPS
ncbi:hypothetical protein [Nocardia grenadensis]|uniref:hypothetical protein n=1 Tax=Nocardia grenadensis TaxID=931537 RepID=UPI003D712C03